MSTSITPAFILIITLASCTFTQKVRTGLQAYEVKQYSLAVTLFEKEYEASSNPAEKAKLAFLAGESYRILNDHGSAGNWYMNAYKSGFGDKALEAYANSLRHQERYQEALKAYEDLLKFDPANTSYRASITVTRQALEWSQQPNPGYKIESLSFNSTASDYSPHPIGPGKILFTSDRALRQNEDAYLWTGRAYSDLFVTNTYSSQVAEYDGSLNSPENEGTAVLSPDGNAIVFTRCYVQDSYDAWCKLMISFRKDASWTKAEPLPFVKEKINYGQPAFAANGSTLFFTSDAPEGHGGHDLYFSQPDGTGGWSEPVNLGPVINSTGEEQYPTVYKDTLYFSSDHLPGLGGLDIFKTYLDASNQWTPPINLRAPVNSGGDDFGFVVDTFASLEPGTVMKGYFTSSRDGAVRNDEIYSFTLTSVLPTTDIAAEPEADKPVAPQINYQVFLAVKVMEPEYEIIGDPNSPVIGRKSLPNGPVVVTEGRLDERFVTDHTGALLLKLEWNQTYIVTAKYRDHLAKSDTISTFDIPLDPNRPITTISRFILLDPIFKDKEIVLENIFYDYDEWFIREDAKPSLDQLAAIMNANPNIRIQLSSHTDCRGTDDYNLDLSQKRAQAAIDYLISTGIAAGRLVAQGFGESNLAVRCECEACTEEEHQRNRRTTFKIID